MLKTATSRLIALATVIALLTTVSCRKSYNIEPFSQPVIKVASDYSVFSVMNYEFSLEDQSLRVVFYESQRIYTLPSSSKDFQSSLTKIRESKEQHLPLKVAIGGNAELQQVLTASMEEIALFKARFTETGTQREEYEDVIASMDELNEIFLFMKQQNCADGYSVLTYCIPFQYKIDGCYARAHKMKQILELHYGYTCSKIFSFQKNLHPLAVNAGECCVLWGWHDAPVVKVNTPGGVISRVIDPSLFDQPVSIKDWLAIQGDVSCDPKAGAGHYEIVPGSYYFSDGTKDPDYEQTNFILALYRNLETCQ